jgi:hypothetical protein
MAGEPAGAAQRVHAGPATLSVAGFVGFETFVEGEVASSEDLATDAEVAGRGAGTLNGPLGAAADELQVVHRRGASTSGVVVGVLGVRSHDPEERRRRDVVPTQHRSTSCYRRRQDFVQPVHPARPCRSRAVGPGGQDQPLGALEPRRSALSVLGPTRRTPSVMTLGEDTRAKRGREVFRCLKVIKACATLRAA